MGNKMRDLKKNEEIFNIFRLFDRDRNGVISAEEMRYTMGKLGHPISRREAEDMLRRADGNGDGLITYQDFYDLMSEPNGKRK